MTDRQPAQGHSSPSAFAGLGVDAAYIEALSHSGITEPSLIQQLAIPPIAAGKDVVVHSGTGTGKTLAYVLPLLRPIDWSSLQLQLLVIVPTQELAMQIVREIEALAGAGKAAPLIGGASMQRQIDRLKKHPVIAVGTPGRLMELLKQRKLKLQGIQHVVIDEVDQVFALGEGAAREIESLLKAVPPQRQLVFVTATVTEAVNRTARKWMSEALTVQGQTQAEASAAVEHQFLMCERRDKIDQVRRLIHAVKPVSALIFVKDTELIGELEAKLKFAGLQVDSLYGDAGKMERATVMKRFASGKLPLLIASDVAARGIDVTRISHIINFEPPADPEQYVHRSGRTGRMGRSGSVITLTTAGERAQLQKLTAKLGIRLTEQQLAYGELREAAVRKPPAKASSAGRPAAEQAKREAAPDAVGPERRSRAVDPNAEAKRKGKEKERDRKRDSKNKGAPRWLKAKQDQQKS